MADYIDREKLLAKIDEAFFETDPDGKEQIGVLKCRAIIREIPAADVAPVAHGRWVTHYRSGTTVAEGYVSTCCDMWNDRRSDYCPSCGARMDGDAERRNT